MERDYCAFFGHRPYDFDETAGILLSAEICLHGNPVPKQVLINNQLCKMATPCYTDLVI